MFLGLVRVEGKIPLFSHREGVYSNKQTTRLIVKKVHIEQLCNNNRSLVFFCNMRLRRLIKSDGHMYKNTPRNDT